MLEDKCHVIDVNIAAQFAITNKKIQKEDFDKFVEIRCKVRDLEVSAGEYQEKIELIEGAIANAILMNPESEETVRHTYEARLNHFHSKMIEKVLNLL